jgi:hypothetical protein
MLSQIQCRQGRLTFVVNELTLISCDCSIDQTYADQIITGKTICQLYIQGRQERNDDCRRRPGKHSEGLTENRENNRIWKGTSYAECFPV